MDVSAEVRERASKIRLVLMDVDGVLTDGCITMGSNGYDGRGFHAHDGHGIRMGQRGGLLFGIVSGRESGVVTERASELYITEVHQGVFDKLACVTEILQRSRLDPQHACFIGDDLVDVPVMRAVGLAVAPPDAVPEVLGIAHHVTRRASGRGVVREVVDLLLRANGKWEQVTERYFK